MLKRLIFGLMMVLLGAFLIACSPQVETVEEAAPVVETDSEAEEVVVVVEDEVAQVVEVAEEEAAEPEAVEDEMEEEMTAEGGEAIYMVSAADSTVSWLGSKPVGNSHTGVIDISEGELTLADGALVAGSFVIDMTTIASTDGAPPRLTEHLNSDDFFGTATFPTASLVINSAESLGGDQYAVMGDLTIKEITNPIEFTATASEADGVVNATADIVFDRAMYDVQFGSGSFFQDLGDDLIADEIEITVELVAMHGNAEMMEEASMSEDTMEAGGEGLYTVSAADSTVSWLGSKPVGNSHTGVIDIAEGELTLADGALVAGSFVIDMTTIASTDGAPPRLTEHLNSDDFFGTATFPTASLVINSAESLGGDQYAVMGDLTIKEITNPIEFTATASEADGVVNATADIVFDRAMYDVQFGSGSFFQDLGDDLIADEIEITVELVAQK